MVFSGDNNLRIFFDNKKQGRPAGSPVKLLVFISEVTLTFNLPGETTRSDRVRGVRK